MVEEEFLEVIEVFKMFEETLSGKIVSVQMPSRSSHYAFAKNNGVSKVNNIFLC